MCSSGPSGNLQDFGADLWKRPQRQSERQGVVPGGGAAALTVIVTTSAPRLTPNVTEPPGLIRAAWARQSSSDAIGSPLTLSITSVTPSVAAAGPSGSTRETMTPARAPVADASGGVSACSSMPSQPAGASSLPAQEFRGAQHGSARHQREGSGVGNDQPRQGALRRKQQVAGATAVRTGSAQTSPGHAGFVAGCRRPMNTGRREAARFEKSAANR